MTSRFISRRCLALLIALVCAAPTRSVRARAPDVGTEAQRESGKRLYLKYCSQCHGEKGDGEGYATSHLHPRPRLHNGQVQGPHDSPAEHSRRIRTS